MSAVDATAPAGGGGSRGEAPAEPAPASWEDVAREYGQMIYSVAYRLTGNPDDAGDVVQDVLLKVQRSLHTYRPGSFRGWLYRITMNTFLDRTRRKKRARLQPLPNDVDRFDAAPSAPAPDEVLESAGLDEEIQAAINDLPPEFKAAVVMCDVVGLPYEEISAQLGVPVGTVRSRIHRGRAILRRRLAHRLEAR